MVGFSLPKNYITDLEAFLRTRRSQTVSSSATSPTSEPAGNAPTPNELMAAKKTLREFSVPAVTNVATGPAIDTAGKNFELRTHHGAGEPILWLAKRGCECTPSTLPRAM